MTKCLHCRQEVVSTGYNFIYVHVDPYDFEYPEECRPTYAAPNFRTERSDLT